MRKFIFILVLCMGLPLCAKAGPPMAGSTGVPITAQVIREGGTALYEKPAETSKELGLLPQGAAVTVTALGVYWCRMEGGGLAGYVPAAALFLDDWGTPEEGGGSESAGPRLAVFNVGMSPGGNWVITLRETPSRKGARMGTYIGGTVMVALEKGKEYTLVHAGDKVGYLLTKYLTFYDQAQTAERYAQVANEDKVNLRFDRRFGDTGISAPLNPGTVVTVLWEKKGWCCVESNGLQGYVVSTFLKTVE